MKRLSKVMFCSQCDISCVIYVKVDIQDDYRYFNCVKKSAYMPHAKNVIKIDCVYGFHLNFWFTFSMKLPRSLRSLAKTNKKVCHRERQRGDPLEELTVHILYHLSRGIFRCAQYDVLFLYVILSMSSEQTCLQGFANDDIHKALAFLIKKCRKRKF